MLATITETLRYLIEEIYREGGVFGLVHVATCVIFLLSAMVGYHCRTEGHERVAGHAIGIAVNSSLLASTTALWLWVNTETGIWAYTSAFYLVWAIIVIVVEVAHYERLRQEEIDKEKYLPKVMADLEAWNKEIEKRSADFRKQSAESEKDKSEWHPYGTFKQNYGTFNQHWGHFT
ncbi:hypothetical protein IKM56_02020 [Candidatus Saccharibacteria bacterium]|nr:hypothetical protein [Candidatus Saccharibacteria bacterium]